MFFFPSCSFCNTFNLIISQDNRKIRIHINSKNLGQFENRNFSASLATGKYIKYLDSDDVIYKHGLEAMVNAIEQFPEAGIAISHNTLHESKPYPNSFLYGQIYT